MLSATAGSPAPGGLDAHEHALLAVALGAREPGLYVLRRRHRLARDVENDVACGQTFAQGGGSIGSIALMQPGSTLEFNASALNRR